ncbi:MAG: hypothetical protein ACLRIL_05510 [Fusicatenibacter saccharivorans]
MNKEEKLLENLEEQNDLGKNRISRKQSNRGKSREARISLKNMVSAEMFIHR